MAKLPILFDTLGASGLKVGDVVHIKRGHHIDAYYRYTHVVKIATAQDSNQILNVQVVGCQDWIRVEDLDPYRYNLYRIGDEVHTITSKMLIYAGTTSKIVEISGETTDDDNPTIYYKLEVDNRSFWWEEKDLLPTLIAPSFVDADVDSWLRTDYCQQCADLYIKEPDSRIGIDHCEEYINNIVQQFKQKTNENRLQKGEASVRGAEKRTGVAICCGRSEATITSRYLSYQAVTG